MSRIQLRFYWRRFPMGVASFLLSRSSMTFCRHLLQTFFWNTKIRWKGTFTKFSPLKIPWIPSFSYSQSYKAFFESWYIIHFCFWILGIFFQFLKDLKNPQTLMSIVRKCRTALIGYISSISISPNKNVVAVSQISIFQNVQFFSQSFVI